MSKFEQVKCKDGGAAVIMPRDLAEYATPEQIEAVSGIQGPNLTSWAVEKYGLHSLRKGKLRLYLLADVGRMLEARGMSRPEADAKIEAIKQQNLRDGITGNHHALLTSVELVARFGVTRQAIHKRLKGHDPAVMIGKIPLYAPEAYNVK